MTSAAAILVCWLYSWRTDKPSLHELLQFCETLMFYYFSLDWILPSCLAATKKKTQSIDGKLQRELALCGFPCIVWWWFTDDLSMIIINDSMANSLSSNGDTGLVMIVNCNLVSLLGFHLKIFDDKLGIRLNSQVAYIGLWFKHALSTSWLFYACIRF